MWVVSHFGSWESNPMVTWWPLRVTASTGSVLIGTLGAPLCWLLTGWDAPCRAEVGSQGWLAWCTGFRIQPRNEHIEAEQNGRRFTDDIFKCIFLYENVWIPIWISLKFVPKGPINNIPALVQIMAWRRPGDKPLSEPMMVRLPTHICVTRPQCRRKRICEKLQVFYCVLYMFYANGNAYGFWIIVIMNSSSYSYCIYYHLHLYILLCLIYVA